MPTYEYRCTAGHKFDRYLPVSEYQTPQTCDCGSSARKIISLPNVFIRPEVRYDSPIDGRAITSEAARREDLARSNCIPYDPEMKTDYTRRQKESEAKLEKSLDETVDREIASMPARKREKLEAELREGVTVEPERITPPAKPITTEIVHG